MARRPGWRAQLGRWLGRDSAPKRPEGGPAEPDLAADRLEAARRRLKDTIQAPEDEARPAASEQ